MNLNDQRLKPDLIALAVLIVNGIQVTENARDSLDLLSVTRGAI